MSLLSLICLSSLIQLIWFKTEAFIEYAKLLKLTSYFGLDEFLKIKETDPFFDYHTFLLEYKNSFLVRLITCPICVSTWIGLISGLITLNASYFPIVGVLGLMLYLTVSKLLKQ